MVNHVFLNKCSSYRFIKNSMFLSINKKHTTKLYYTWLIVICVSTLILKRGNLVCYVMGVSRTIPSEATLCAECHECGLTISVGVKNSYDITGFSIYPAFNIDSKFLETQRKVLVRGKKLFL